jgi:hypothetical protein
MKLTNLKEMIQRSVREAVLESAFEQYDEAAIVPDGDSLEEKIDKAAHIVADCARTMARLASAGRVHQFDAESLMEKCTNECVRLFLDKDGDFSDPDAEPARIEEALIEKAHRLIGENDDREIKFVTRLGFRVGHALEVINEPEQLDEAPPEMTNKGGEPHYKEQPSSKHGKAVHKEDLYESSFQKPNFFTLLK